MWNARQTQLEWGSIGELVEESMEGSCLCFVGQPEVAIGQ